MPRRRAAVFLVAAACATTRAEPPGDPVEAPATWAALTQRLPGRWIGTTGTRSTPVEYRLIAGNSVLVETFGRPGHETKTTYHADRRGLMATHYCAQGNQPRLRMRAGGPRQLTFTLADVTGKDADEAVLVELDYDFTTAGGFDRIEVYRQPDGKLERTSWRFVPAPP
jgi:hypothetical protein